MLGHGSRCGMQGYNLDLLSPSLVALLMHVPLDAGCRSDWQQPQAHACQLSHEMVHQQLAHHAWHACCTHRLQLCCSCSLISQCESEVGLHLDGHEAAV